MSESEQGVEVASPFQIKALTADGLRIGGYGVVFGSAQQRDTTGEWFTPQTELGLDWPIKTRYMFYNHGLDPVIGDEPIGVIDTFKTDDVGVWVEGQLNAHSKWAAAVCKLIEKGALGWSSGSLPQSTVKARSGELLRWPIIEVSPTPTPAEPRSTGISLKAVAAACKSLGFGDSNRKQENQEGFDVDVETMKTAMRDVVRDALAAESEANVKTLHRGRLPAPGAPDETARIEVTRATKYSDLSASDMSLMSDIMGSTGWRPPVTFYRELADKMVKSVQRGDLPYSAMERLEQSGFLKSQELDNTGQAGFGAEWAPDSWRGELWLRVRQDNVVAPALEMIEMPTQPYELPIEAADPSVYYVSETTDQGQLVLTSSNPIPQSKTATNKVQMRAQKLALRMAWSSELNEDVLIPIVANYRRQAIRAMQNAMDNVLLNGDTALTANTNINAIDGTPVGGSKYLAFNGLRKYCLVTNPALSYNANGPITLPLLRKARFLMNGAYALRPRDLVLFVDDPTYAKMLSMPEFISIDKAGADVATNVNGLLGHIDGIEVRPTAEMGLSQATNGDLSVTPANNTRGQAIFAFRPLWYVGYRRQVTATLDHIAYADIYHLIVTARLCLVAQDQYAGSTPGAASMLYGISV